jgi:hypothetical protein
VLVEFVENMLYMGVEMPNRKALAGDIIEGFDAECQICEGNGVRNRCRKAKESWVAAL